MKISQREARRLRKRVDELERQIDRNNAAWCGEWVGGIHLQTLGIDHATYRELLTARKLGHAVVVTTPNNDQIQFYAVKP